MIQITRRLIKFVGDFKLNKLKGINWQFQAL